MSRRGLLHRGVAGLALVALGGGAPRATTAGTDPAAGEDDFAFEVERSDAEWRALLKPEEYFVLRARGTEVPHSSLLTFEDRPGRYHCKGCDLWLYESRFKVLLPEIGWAFFSVSRANAVLTGIDFSNPYLRAGAMATPDDVLIEAHCRRCGSHLGHITLVKGRVLHCINGIALRYVPEAA